MAEERNISLSILEYFKEKMNAKNAEKINDAVISHNTDADSHKDIRDLITNLQLEAGSVIQSDWDQNDVGVLDYIKNKPPIKKGAGLEAMVFGKGNANSDYSIAGGNMDSSKVSQLKTAASAAGLNIDTDDATANGAGSLALGVGTKTHSTASISIGVSNSAGAKGFYWHSIDWTGEKPVIQLSTEQKPYRYYVVLGQTIKQNENATWNTNGAN